MGKIAFVAEKKSHLPVLLMSIPLKTPQNTPKNPNPQNNKKNPKAKHSIILPHTKALGHPFFKDLQCNLDIEGETAIS